MNKTSGFGIYNSGGGGGGSTDTVAISFHNVNNASLADDTSYYLGQQTTIQTSPNSIAWIPVPAGTVTNVLVQIYNASTIGSSEEGTITLYSNGGADSDVITTTQTFDANRHSFDNYSDLGIEITEGDAYFEITTPTLTTNPTACQFRITLIIQLA